MSDKTFFALKKSEYLISINTSNSIAELWHLAKNY